MLGMLLQVNVLRQLLFGKAHQQVFAQLAEGLDRDVAKFAFEDIENLGTVEGSGELMAMASCVTRILVRAILHASAWLAKNESREP